MPAQIAPIGKYLTSTMVAECFKRSENMSIAIGTVERTVTDGVRVVYVTNCHDRHAGETQASGAYHGCSVWLDTSSAAEKETDWAMVGLSAGAIGVVVWGFWYVAKRVNRRA